MEKKRIQPKNLRLEFHLECEQIEDGERCHRIAVEMAKTSEEAAEKLSQQGWGIGPDGKVACPDH